MAVRSLQAFAPEGNDGFCAGGAGEVGRGSAVGPAGNATDGGGFSLSLEYTDGRKARARGGTFSKDYREARDEIWGFLGDVLKRSGARPTRMKRIEFERLQRELSK